MTLTGTGFSADSSIITVCGVACEIIGTPSATQAKCIVPQSDAIADGKYFQPIFIFVELYSCILVFSRGSYDYMNH